MGSYFRVTQTRCRTCLTEAPIGASWSGLRLFPVVSRRFAGAATGTLFPEVLPGENGESVSDPAALRNRSLRAPNERRVGGENAPVFNGSSTGVLRYLAPRPRAS